MRRWTRVLGKTLGVVFLLAWSMSSIAATDDEIWILIDDREATLDVYRGDTRIEHFAPISLGRGGTARVRLQGSNMTPTGEFHINRIDHDSKFHIFLGLNYPKLETARAAMRAGLMTPVEYADFQESYYRHDAPPQDTVLGGYIGIHGLGDSDPEIHRRFHWTEGCIAVTDPQIETLARLVTIGTRVVIRGDNDAPIASLHDMSQFDPNTSTD